MVIHQIIKNYKYDFHFSGKNNWRWLQKWSKIFLGTAGISCPLLMSFPMNGNSFPIQQVDLTAMGKLVTNQGTKSYLFFCHSRKKNRIYLSLRVQKECYWIIRLCHVDRIPLNVENLKSCILMEWRFSDLGLNLFSLYTSKPKNRCKIWKRIELIQRVPALRAFWDLEKTVLHEIHVSGTVLWSPTNPKIPTCTCISQKPW